MRCIPFLFLMIIKMLRKKPPQDTTQLHGTAVKVNGEGVLLLGESGCGKSDLALRLLDRGHQLIADDVVLLKLEKGVLLARPAEAIEKTIECRGIGLIEVASIGATPISLLIRLVDADSVPRLPEFETESLLGLTVRRLYLCAYEVSAPLKVEYAVAQNDGF